MAHSNPQPLKLHKNDNSNRHELLTINYGLIKFAAIKKTYTFVAGPKQALVPNNVNSKHQRIAV
jgi:hypothetical protein